MCILLWTLPNCNHPRFKFVLASNRDEFMRRPTSRPVFWDLATILQTATTGDNELASVHEHPQLDLSSVGILSSLDLQPALRPEDYHIEVEYSPADGNTATTNGNINRSLRVEAKNIPGTWIGITTHGDLVALTNYRESLSYRPPPGSNPLSRGKITSEYLAAMAANHAVNPLMAKQNAAAIDSEPTDTQEELATTAIQVGEALTTIAAAAPESPGTVERQRDLAETWLRKRAQGWETTFEGFNLLLVHQGGDKQYIGSNREGSHIHVLAGDSNMSVTVSTDSSEPTALKAVEVIEDGVDPKDKSSEVITTDRLAGVSNSIFINPWDKIHMGTKALADVLNKDLEIFGDQEHVVSPSTSIECDEQTELAWMVIQLLTMMRTTTSPFPPGHTSASQLYEGVRKRIFIPQISLLPLWGPGSASFNEREGGGLPPAEIDYGTRSSTVVLFGRKSNVAVYVDKVWYGDWDEKMGHRPEYAIDSVDGLVWWQGEIGKPPSSWKQIQGEELEQLLERAKSIADVSTSP